MSRSLPEKLRWLVLQRDDFTCQYCRATGAEVRLHVDHVVPVADGGANAVANLRTACESCNRGKGSIALFEYTEFYRAWNARDMDMATAALVNIACRKFIGSDRGWATLVLYPLDAKHGVHAIEAAESWQCFIANCYYLYADCRHEHLLPEDHRQHRLDCIERTWLATWQRFVRSRSSKTEVR